MRVHSPRSVEQIIAPVFAKVLLFHTVGMIGGFAVRSGVLTIPETDCPFGCRSICRTGIYIYMRWEKVSCNSKSEDNIFSIWRQK